MLNKDEYNQDEYNDYYRQETQGAEITSSEEESSGAMGKIIAFLILIALAIGGYFGYKAMNTSHEDVDNSLKISMESSLPQTTQKESTEEEEEVVVEETKEETKITEPVKTVEKETKSNTVETAIVNQVQKTISSDNKKMTPNEVAAIVAAVMQQMNQQKDTATVSNQSVAEKKDVELMNSLSDTDVDSVSDDLIKELANIDIDENANIDNNDNSKKQIDVYNKVNVQNSVGDDALSQLSDEINSVINEGVDKNRAASYTANITKEVATRKNEMRIIVVKKGDTLGRIAQRAYGNMRDYKKIYRANPEVTRPDRIYIGQKLRIPN